MSRADPEHHRDRAQRAEDAADAERVGDRLAQPVARRGSRSPSSVAAWPPTWIMLNAKSAPVERRAAVEVASRTSARRPSCCARPARHRLARSPAARGRCRAARCRRPAGRRSESRSPSRSRVNSMLPAPMNAMRVTCGSIAHLRDSAQLTRDPRRNAHVRGSSSAKTTKPTRRRGFREPMELRGLEPPTSWVRSRRSPQLSYSPGSGRSLLTHDPQSADCSRGATRLAGRPVPE